MTFVNFLKFVDNESIDVICINILFVLYLTIEGNMILQMLFRGAVATSVVALLWLYIAQYMVMRGSFCVSGYSQ